MADIEERLRILVEAQSTLKSDFAAVQADLDRFKGKIDSAERSMGVANRTAGSLSSTLGVFLKRLTPLLAIDFGARILGFSSALAAINQGLDFAADKTRDLLLAGFDKLFTTDQDRQARSLADAIAGIAEESKKLGEEIRAQTRAGITDIEGLGFGIDVRGFGEDLEAQKQAVDEILSFYKDRAERIKAAREQLNIALLGAVTADQRAELRGFFEETVKSIEQEGSFSELMRRLGRGFAGEFSVGFNAALQALVFTKTPDAIRSEFESQKARLLSSGSEGIGFGTVDTRPDQTIEDIKRINAEIVRLVQQNIALKEVQAELLTGTQREIALLEIATLKRDLAAKAAFAAGKRDEDTTNAILSNLEEIERRALASILFTEPKLSFFEAIKRGAQEAVDSIGDIEEQGRRLGFQLFDGLAFSIESTFNGIADGSIKAKKAAEEFFKSLLLNIARALNQLAALRIAMSIFGALSTSSPASNAVPGGGQAPFTPGGGAAPFGGKATALPATGSVVNINMNVTGGGQQLLQQMPEIARQLAAAVTSGRSREMRVAIREA